MEEFYFLKLHKIGVHPKKLIFKGGITGSRGHIGDNKGLTAAINALKTGGEDYKEFYVFGCPIMDELGSYFDIRQFDRM